MEIKPINPWTWQDSFGFSQAIEVSGHQRTLICSGQTSVDENGAPMHDGDIVAQANKALDNLQTVLRAAGMELSNVIRLNYYTTDVDGFMGAAAELVPRLAQAGCRPASTLLGVPRLAFRQLMLEIEAIAVA